MLERLKNRFNPALGTGYLDELKYYDDPALQKKLLSILKSGHNLSIVIHKNTHPFLKELGESGANLYYSPILPPQIVDIVGDGVYARNNRKSWFGLGIGVTNASKDFLAEKTAQLEKYQKNQIPADKIGIVFEMINSDQPSSKIVEYLKGF